MFYDCIIPLSAYNIYMARPKKPRKLKTIKKIYAAFLVFINIPALFGLATTLFYFYTWSEQTLVALFWLYLAWQKIKTEKLQDAPSFESRYLLAALATIIISLLTNLDLFMWLGAALSLYSYLVYFHGTKQAVRFIPLLGLLLFLSRVNSPTALELFSLNLRILATKTATFWLQALGLPATNISTTAIATPRLICTIDTACSGMNFLYSLCVLSLIIAYYQKFYLRQSLILLLSGFTFALLANIIRIFLLFIVGYFFGEKIIASGSFFHSAIGVFLFLGALGLVLGLARLLKRA